MDDCVEGSMDWYASKRAIVGRLDGLIDRLTRAGVSPDAVTLSAVPVAVAGGLALLASPLAPPVLVLVPVLIAVRLILNVVDGALARSTGRTHPRGELFNELGDRLADIAFLVPVAFLPGAQRETVLLGVTGAVLASFVGVTTRAAVAERLDGGVLSKPGRMVVLAVF